MFKKQQFYCTSVALSLAKVSEQFDSYQAHDGEDTELHRGGEDQHPGAA